MLNNYKLETQIVIYGNYYRVYDIQSGHSEKQAKFEFYQRIKMHFKIDNITFVEKVGCRLIKKNVRIPILDFGFKNFEVYE
jgi:hypothetical protein